MAGEMGLDPPAVRRANLLQAPTFTDNDLMVNSYGLPECIDWVEKESGWVARKGKLPKGKGLGFACSHYISGIQAGELDRRAARHVKLARFRRLHRGADGRRRHWLVLPPAGADGRRGAGPHSCWHAHRLRRQRRGAEGQRLLLLASPSSSATRQSMPPTS
jgi:hypothetical protein